MECKKRGQAAIEYAMIIVIVLFIVVAFMAVLSDKLTEANARNYVDSLDAAASVIEAEATIALGSANGYFHAFTMPPKLGGKPYRINFINSTLIQRNASVLWVNATQGKINYTVERVFQRDVLGNLVRGKNTVRKEKGLVIFMPIPLTAAQAASCGIGVEICSEVDVTNEECCDHLEQCCSQN